MRRLYIILILLSPFVIARAAEKVDPVTLGAQATKTTVFIFYDYTKDPSGEVSSASGSGFIVRKDGTVLTAYHVLVPWMAQNEVERRHHPLRGRLGSINSADAVGLIVVDYDAVSDLAILRLRDNRNDYPTTSLCYTNDIPAGTSFLAFGFPRDHELTPFPGLISNADGPEGRWSANVNFEEGTSGGPVYDDYGQVIGVIKGGLGSITSIRFVTQVVRASPMLQKAGVASACFSRLITTPRIPARPVVINVVAQYLSKTAIPGIGSDVSNDLRSGKLGGVTAVITPAGDSFLRVGPLDKKLPDFDFANSVFLDTRDGQVRRIRVWGQVFSQRPGDDWSRSLDGCEGIEQSYTNLFSRIFLKTPVALSSEEILRNLDLPADSPQTTVLKSRKFADNGIEVWVYILEARDRFYIDERRSCTPEVLIK